MRCLRACGITLLLVTFTTRLVAQAPAKNPAELSADSLLKAGNASGALRAYQALTQGDSTVPRYWRGIGNAAYALKQYGLAASGFERAARIGQNPVVMYNAGAMHALMGHTDVALDWLDKAVTAGFPLPAMFSTDADLASLRGNPRFDAIAKRAAVALTPCMSDPNARKFDFWVGEWDVTQAGATQVVGHSLIQVIAGGCALLENWTAPNGSEGKSINTYNATVKQWQQYWIGQMGGLTEYRESHWEGPSLVFLAHSVNASGPFLQRLTFTPLDANTVRQFGEISTDDGKTWSTGYDFHYHRKK